MRLSKPQQSEPSYKAGFARSAGESANPQLWDKLIGAWYPAMGQTGDTLIDLTGRGQDGAIHSNVSWKFEQGAVLDFPGTDNNLAPVDIPLIEYPDMVGQFTLTARGASDAVSYDTWLGITDSSSGFNQAQIGGNSTYYQAIHRNGAILNAVGTAMAAGEWRTITGTFDGIGGSVNFFEDGAFQSTATGFVTDFTPDRCWIGALGDSTPASYHNGRIAMALIHNRLLSADEIKLLALDPLAPFRQRKSIPFRFEAAADTTSGSVIRLRRPQVSEPSYKAGFADSPSSSANPGLWDGLINAYAPNLGPATQGLVDLSGNGIHTTATGVTPWGKPDGFWGCLFGDLDNKTLNNSVPIGTENRSWTIRMDWDIASYLTASAASAPDVFSDRVLGGLGTQPGFVIGRSGKANGQAADGIACLVEDGSGNYKQNWYDILLTTTTIVTVTFTWENSTGDIRCYLNGTEAASNYNSQDVSGGTVAGKSIGNSGTTKIGQRPGTTDRDFQNYLFCLYTHNRILSQEEIRLLWKDQLAPFRQRQRFTFSQQAAAATAFWRPITILT